MLVKRSYPLLLIYFILPLTLKATYLHQCWIVHFELIIIMQFKHYLLFSFTMRNALASNTLWPTCSFVTSSYSCYAFAVFIICSCYWFLCHWYWFTTRIATMISASSSVDASIHTLVIALSSTKWDTQQNRNLNILWARKCLLRTPNSSYLCSSLGFSLFPKYLRQILATWQRYCNNLFRSGTLGFWPFLLPEITLWQAVIL